MTIAKQHLLALTPEELTERITALGMPKFRVKQIHEWIFEKRATSFQEMTNLSLADRGRLEEQFAIFTSTMVRRQTASDGTDKILLQWPGNDDTTKTDLTTEDDDGTTKTQSTRRPTKVDLKSLISDFKTTNADAESQVSDLTAGKADSEYQISNLKSQSSELSADEANLKSQISNLNAPRSGLKVIEEERAALTETVMIPADDDRCDDYGNTVVAHRRTACLSTQVGCPVGCAFCASGIGGLQSSLGAGEIVEQALRLTHLLPVEGAGHRLTNIVFMGMGEPLANLNATVAAIRVLMAPWAFHISARKITVSTVGLPTQMKRLADLEIPVTLALSLHAPNDELRRQIIPWANKISLQQIVDAGRYYFDKTGRELTIEYIMLDGVNTATEHARQLARIAKELRANVNLIYYNEVPELRFRRPTGPTMFGFQATLRAAHVNAHIRKSRGRDIAAACGQLARQNAEGKALGH